MEILLKLLLHINNNFVLYSIVFIKKYTTFSWLPYRYKTHHYRTNWFNENHYSNNSNQVFIVYIQKLFLVSTQLNFQFVSLNEKLYDLAFTLFSGFSH